MRSVSKDLQAETQGAHTGYSNENSMRYDRLVLSPARQSPTSNLYATEQQSNEATQPGKITIGYE